MKKEVESVIGDKVDVDFDDINKLEYVTLVSSTRVVLHAGPFRCHDYMFCFSLSATLT